MLGLDDPTSVFVVSLDADINRYEEMRHLAQLSADVKFCRTAGVLGSTLPRAACDILTKTLNYHVGKGALGCFLAHVAAWEAISNESGRYAVILEDDAGFAEPSSFARLEIPSDADLVFLNERAQPVELINYSGTPIYSPVALLMKRLAEPARMQRDIGTDGYALTPNGAAKLIAAVSEDWFYGHVDWRLLRYSTTEQETDAVLAESSVASVLKNHHCFPRPRWNVIKTYIHSPALVSHIWSPSRRVAQDDQ